MFVRKKTTRSGTVAHYLGLRLVGPEPALQPKARGRKKGGTHA
jgi:hypothetical protein